MKDLIKKILKEENDFDWVRDTEPTSKEEIAKELASLRDFGYYIHKADNNRLVSTIHSLGLDHNSLNTLYKTLEDFADTIYERGREQGQQDAWGEGHREGYDEGYEDAERDIRGEMEGEAEDKYEEGRDSGYNEGYDEGYEEGYQKGREEGSEKTYYKAFEEGRAYEAGLDTEDYEKRQSAFDPREYDEDYNENY